MHYPQYTLLSLMHEVIVVVTESLPHRGIPDSHASSGGVLLQWQWHGLVQS